MPGRPRTPANTSPGMAAPGRRRMKQACTQAAEHYRREHLQHAERVGSQITITVDRVPHLAPAVGDTPDWYRVGSLLVEPDHLMLNVYLHAATDAVKLEQALEDVIPNDDIAPEH